MEIQKPQITRAILSRKNNVPSQIILQRHERENYGTETDMQTNVIE